MSVGEGSIRRAAKAASVKPEEAKAVKTKTAVKVSARKPVAKQEKQYGIGEELPIYLM